MREMRAASHKENSSFFMLLPSHAFSHVHVLLRLSSILLYELRKKRDGLKFINVGNKHWSLQYN